MLKIPRTCFDRRALTEEEYEEFIQGLKEDLEKLKREPEEEEPCPAASQ